MVNVRNLVEEGFAAGAWPDNSSAIYVSNYADILWNYIPTIIPDEVSDSFTRNSSHRQKCNAAQARPFLDDRFNSLSWDRLAILVNLCDYDFRVDSKVLKHSNNSFTICALTLAILNGDMSLLAGYRDEDERQQDQTAEYLQFLWLATNARSNGTVYSNDDGDLPSNT